MIRDRRPAVDDTGASLIARLEQALADEREHTAALRSELEELKFRIGILDKSYAKQLEDARKLLEAAERSRMEQVERNAELDAARTETIDLLSDTRIEIDRLTAERDGLRRRIDGGDTPDRDFPGDGDADGGTINRLMSDAAWLRRNQAAGQRGPAGDHDGDSAGDMLDPDVMLAAVGSDD